MSGSATGRRVASLDTDRTDAVASSPPFPGPHSIKAPLLPREDTPWATRSPRLPDVQQQERQQQEGMRKGSPKVYKHLLQSARSMSPSCRSAASYRAPPVVGGSLSPINHVGSPAQHSPKTSILQTARHLSFTGNPPTSLSRLQTEEVQKELNEYSNQMLQHQQHQQQPGTPGQGQQQQVQPQQASPLQSLLGARLALEPSCDSPERPMRRASTSTPLHMFAVHHSALEATQQQQAASGTSIRAASCTSSTGGLPAAGPGWIPPSSYSHLGLDVHECLASLGSDTPCDSPCSGCTNMGSLDSPHPPSTSRLGGEQRRLLPRPPSSSGGSASSTPHSAPGGALQPHPPPPPFLQRKNSLQGKALAPLQEHGAPGSYQESSPLACMELGGAGSRPYSGRRHRVAPPLAGLDLSRSSSFTSSSAPASTSSLAPSSGTRAAPTLNMGVFASGGFMPSSLGHDSSQPSSPTGSMQLRAGLGGSSPLDEAAYRAMSNSYGSASDLGLNSPVGAAAAAAAAQRPNSGRQKPAQLLAEAVKSNNLGNLEKTIRYLTEEKTGGVVGLNDRHPLSQHTALSEAVSQNNKAMVERLLAAGSNPNIGHISQGGPLLLAAGYGHLAMVECLLKAGADPMARDGMAATALHAAMASGHVNIAVLLLQHGSDPNAANENGERPFELVKDVNRLLEQVGPDLVVALAGGRDQLSPNTAGLLGHAMHQQQQLQQHQQQQQQALAIPVPPTSGGHSGSLPRIASSSSSLGGTSATQPAVLGSLGSWTRRHSLTGSAAGTPRSCGGGGTPPISPPALKDGMAPEGTTLRPCPPEAPRELSSNSSSYGPRSRVHSAVESAPGEALLSVDSRGAEEERAPTPPVLTLPSQFPHLRKSRTLTKGGAQQEDILASFREEDQDLLKAAQTYAGVSIRPEGTGVGPSSSGRSEAWLPGQSPLSNNSSAAQLPVSARSELRSSKGNSPASHVTTPVGARAAGALGTSPAHGSSSALGGNAGSIMSRMQEAAAAASQASRQQQARQQQQQLAYRPGSAQPQQQQQQQHRPARPVTPQQDMQQQPVQVTTPQHQQQQLALQQQTTPPQQTSPFANGFAMLSCGTPVRFGLPPGGSSEGGSGTPSGSSMSGRPSLQVPSLPRFGFGSSPLAAFDMGDSSMTGQHSGMGSGSDANTCLPSTSSTGSNGGGGSSANGLPARPSNSQGGSSTSGNAVSSSSPFHRPVGTLAAAAGSHQAMGVATEEDSLSAVSSTGGAATIPALESAFGSVVAASWRGSSNGVSPEQSSEQLQQERSAGAGWAYPSAAAAAQGADRPSQSAAAVAAAGGGDKRVSPTSESPGMSPQQVEGVWGSCACTPPQSPAGVVSALATPPPPSVLSPSKPILASAGGGMGSRSSRSKVAAQQQQQKQPQQQGSRGSTATAAGSAATGAAPWLLRSPGGDTDEDEDDLAAAAAEADDLVPPLIRASSPDAMSPKGPLGELPLIKQLTKPGQEDAEKVIRAAEELRKVAVDASAEAVEVRAAHMFGKCVDMETDDMAWTRGELLGEGAYGKVYAGLNQSTGELMAVKVLQLGRGSSGAASAHLTEVLKEIDLYKTLKHKHVVGYIDARYEAAENTLFIFLEYVPGGSIASMLERFGCFHIGLVRKYTRQLLQGLEFLHAKHIVHRDLKGANVLVSRGGIIKLADFGASKMYSDARTDAMKSMRGSVYWMAPEVIKGSYGRRADIWSLGCTVIEMLTGRHPWPDLDNHFTTMYAIVNNPEGPPRPATLDPLVGSFLDECLKHDFRDRPTAAQLLQHPWIAEEQAGGGGGGQ